MAIMTCDICGSNLSTDTADDFVVCGLCGARKAIEKVTLDETGHTQEAPDGSRDIPKVSPKEESSGKEASEDSTFTDPRDGKVYKTVKIGNQVWMAENLNYDAHGSWCYGNDPANAKKYGRLYDWDTAKKACPPGWHLPDRWEWQTLVNFADGPENAGEKLKASRGWNDHRGRSGNGIDAYGFSALPGGGDSNGSFDKIGAFGNWWTSTAYDGDNAYHQYMGFNFEGVYKYNVYKSAGFAVRCIRDKDDGQAKHSGSASQDKQDKDNDKPIPTIDEKLADVQRERDRIRRLLQARGISM